MTQASGDAEEFMRGPNEEIKRRRTLYESDHIERSAFDRVADASCPKTSVLEDQAFVLFSLSQTCFAPVRRQHAALRVYGTFETVDDARDHARRVHEVEPHVSMLVGQTHQWLLGAETPERWATSSTLISEKLDRYMRQREKDVSQFRDERKQPSEEECDAAAADASDNESVEGDTDVGDKGGDCKSSRRLPASVQVCGQRSVVMSVICDDTHEFVFRIYGCLDTDSEADVWVRNVLSTSVTDFDIDITDTCRWIVPSRMTGDDVPRHVYRHAELDAIMKNHREEPARVKEYKDWCAEHNVDESQPDRVELVQADDSLRESAATEVS